MNEMVWPQIETKNTSAFRYWSSWRQDYHRHFMFKSKGNHLKRCRQSLAYCCVDTLEPVSEQEHLLIYKQFYVNINIIIFFHILQECSRHNIQAYGFTTKTLRAIQF